MGRAFSMKPLEKKGKFKVLLEAELEQERRKSQLQVELAAERTRPHIRSQSAVRAEAPRHGCLGARQEPRPVSPVEDEENEGKDHQGRLLHDVWGEGEARALFLAHSRVAWDGLHLRT